VAGEAQPPPLGVADPVTLDGRGLLLGLFTHPPSLGTATGDLAGRAPDEQDDAVQQPDTAPAPTEESRLQRALVLVAIVVLAFNLRPTAVSVGPVLDEISTALGMSPVVAGVLTTLPVLAFAGFGALAPWAARKAGIHRVTFGSLLAVVAGTLVRSLTDSVGVFLLMSLVGLAGMAAANVLLPSLVKLHFPRRIGLVTSLYTTSLAIGLTLGSVLTVPLAEAFGSWRWGLAAWSVTALVAAIPWLALLRRDTGLPATATTVSLGAVARTRLGWAMAVLFGMQSLQAYAVFGWFAQVYRDAGFSPTTAGLLLGVVTGVSIPLSFILPALAARLHDQTVLMCVLVACYPVGYLGLVFAPVSGAWAWAFLIGVACSVFPVVLTLIGLRSRTSTGTAALSGFTQSVGYLIAAIGPFGMGVLYDLTGGWTVPLVTLSVLSLLQLLAGLLVARPAYVEDELAAKGLAEVH
jgi:CP family cyanate transporter-like MFS transporter